MSQTWFILATCPIQFLTNQDDSYKIIVYKFRTKNNQNLLKNSKINKGNISTNGLEYNTNKLNLDVKAGIRFESMLHDVNYLSVDVDGNAIKNTIKTDSLLGYDFDVKTVAITFNKDSDPNIYLINESFFKNISAQILFYKKQDFLYLLVLSSSKAKDISNPNLLLSLVKK